MSEWKIISKKHDFAGDLMMQLMSLGISVIGGMTYRYVVEHEDTGEQKTVYARDEYELGDAIADGDFIEP